MEKAVVTSFFKDKRCYNLFSRVAAPIAGDSLAVLRDHIRDTDPASIYPPKVPQFQSTNHSSTLTIFHGSHRDRNAKKSLKERRQNARFSSNFSFCYFLRQMHRTLNPRSILFQSNLAFASASTCSYTPP